MKTYLTPPQFHAEQHANTLTDDFELPAFELFVYKGSKYATPYDAFDDRGLLFVESIDGYEEVCLKLDALQPLVSALDADNLMFAIALRDEKR